MKLTLNVRAEAHFDKGARPGELPPESPPVAPESPPAASVVHKLLEVQPVGQKMQNWCWAASSQMLTEYLRGESQAGVSQCALASKMTNKARKRKGKPLIDCCDPQDDQERKECNQPSWPFFSEFDDRAESTMWSGARHVLECRGVHLAPNGPLMTVGGGLSNQRLRRICDDRGIVRQIEDCLDYALSWEALTRLIDGQCPVAFSWRWGGGGGHMMVAAGYVVTPPDKKWVIVFDPLPPGSGDRFLVPYETYVRGRHGRHFRDYWVPLPPPGPKRKGPFRHPLAELPPSRRFVRTAARQWPLEVPAETADGEILTPEDKDAARRAAEAGLEALRAIARDAPDVALMMGMGGNILQTLGKPLLPALAKSAGLGGEAPEPPFRSPIWEVTAKELAPSLIPGELTLDPEPFPEYDLTAEDLQTWDGKDEEKLLGKGNLKYLHFNVLREDAGPFSFFATITVRQTEGGWRLFTLGKVALMQTQGLQQLFSDAWKERTVAELLVLLSKLGVLGPLWTVVKQLREDADFQRQLESPAALDMLMELRKGWDELKTKLRTDDEVQADVKQLSEWLDELEPVENKPPENLGDLVAQMNEPNFDREKSEWVQAVKSAKEMAERVHGLVERTLGKDAQGRLEDLETLARLLDEWLLLEGPKGVADAAQRAVAEATDALQQIKPISELAGLKPTNVEKQLSTLSKLKKEAAKSADAAAAARRAADLVLAAKSALEESSRRDMKKSDEMSEADRKVLLEATQRFRQAEKNAAESAADAERQDRMIARRKGSDKSEPPEARQPELAIHASALYQLFLVYEDPEEVESVYKGPGFYPPGRKSVADTKYALLADLKGLAEGRDVSPWPARRREGHAEIDLQKIEGIGPEIEGLLNAAGIHTWAQLAAASIADLQAVLDQAGPEFQMHDPATWRRQAALADAGKWDELEELQDRLEGGREA